MAINSQDIFRPYVHSNIMNFINEIANTTEGTNVPNATIQKYIDETINKLQVLITNLKNSTDAFLGSQTLEQVLSSSNDSNSNSTSLFTIAMRVLGTPQLYDQERASYNDLLTEFQKDFSEKIAKELREASTLTDFTNALAKRLQKQPSREGQLRYLSRIFGEDVQRLLGVSLTRRLTSAKGVLNKFVKNVLRSRAQENGREVRNNFLGQFRKLFIAEGTKERYTEEELNNYYQKFEAECPKDTDPIWTLPKENFQGAAGEDFIEVASLATGTQVIFKIGNINEEDVSAHLKKVLQGKKINKQDFNNFTGIHGANKQSQSDLVLYNPNTGHLARVQSKNYQTILNQVLSGNIIPQIITLQDQTQIQQFFNLLNNSNQSIITQEYKELLSYLIANEIWFRSAGSYNGNRTERQTGVRDTTTNIGFVQDLVNKMMTIVVQELLGFYGKDINPDSLIGRGNIYFLIDNIVYIPVFEILEDLKKSLEDYKRKIFEIQATLQLNADFAYPTARAFYKAKTESVTALDPNGNYVDGVYDVGTKQGESIISSATFNLNLRINLQDLIKTALNSTELQQRYIAYYGQR